MQRKKIGLIKNNNAYLTEIDGYFNVLSERGHEVRILEKSADLTDENIEWHFLGIDTTPKIMGRMKIHEYASLSVPPIAHFKNRLKKIINTPPHLRVFNNNFVKSQMNFKDNIHSTIRIAGIGKHFFQKHEIPKTFDFVYIGTMDKSRKIDMFLDVFIEHFQESTLLLIGKPPQHLAKRVAKNANIFCINQIKYVKVPFWLQKARFGINFIPQVYPFEQQASLKLLEYCASGLPVITTSYEWVNHFEQKREANFFKLLPDLSNFRPHLIESFNFKIPKVKDFTWENVFLNSGLLEFIEN